MPRPVLILHRWLGVFVGALMTLWCLSGFVMMYVDYPRLAPAEQGRGLAPLRLTDRAALARVGLPADTPLASARLEMLAGRAVLRIVPAVDPARPIAQLRASPASYDLATGKPLVPLQRHEIHAVAADFAARTGIEGPPARVAETGIDQWTVQTFQRNRPLYRVDFADPAGTVLYIAGGSGEAVQRTTRFQRFWGWLGAVPHWLYPTLLRQNGAAWSQVVIWTSLAGCFLTGTGLWVGIARLRRRRDGSVGSPYRGLWWWHHMAGLFFGVLTLSWVASGLFSMNPWGFLDSSAGSAERQRLAGTVRWDAVRSGLMRMDAVPPGTVRLESAPLGGTAFLVAKDGEGTTTRFGPTGRVAPLGQDELRRALAEGPPVASLDLLREGDAYHYAHKQPVTLPVWRAILADREGTRLYVDPDSGQLIRAVDRNARGFRWLQDGLHRLDVPGLRARPIWDAVVLVLLAGVTLACATGTWMGGRKLLRDLRKARLRRRRRAAVGLSAPQRI